MKNEQKEMVGELSENVIPLNYNLSFDTNIKTFIFNCDETIQIEIKELTDTIILNAKELNIKKLEVKQNSNIIKSNFKINDEKEIITIKLAERIKGGAELYFNFDGKNTDSLYGFYRSKYKYNNKTEYLLSTQFESSAARMAFVSFDEPKFKTTFNLTVISDPDFEAISNTPVKEVKLENINYNGKKKKRKVTTFYQTPKMSSYLLYFNVGKFDRISTMVGNIKLSVITPRGQIKYADLALNYGSKFLKALEDYFGIDFPLPKLDLISIPDFAVGAMENWGAITFRETALLIDSKNMSESGKRRIADVICHEMVHQWFGDLVTMKWWDDLWLNESFATFMSYKIVNKVFPEMKMDINYYLDEVVEAFSADSLKYTHPINAHVRTVGEIASMFDSISYSKGGSILLMIEDYMGEEAFRKGLHNYLKAHEYGNATRFDLWGALSDVYSTDQNKKKEFVDFIKSWIDQPGYPIINVLENKKGFILKQKRFTLLNEKTNEKWLIPIHYFDGKKDYRIMMKNNVMVLPKSNFIKLNYGQKGFYQVAYPEKLLNNIAAYINSKYFSELDVYGLENDLFMRSRASLYPIKNYLNFVKNYLFDVGYPTNLSIISHLNWIKNITEGTDTDISEFAKNLNIEFCKSIINKIGFEARKNEKEENKLVRSSALFVLGINNDQKVIEFSKKLFYNFVNNNIIIDQNLINVVYSVTAHSSNNKKILNTLLNMYNNLKTPQEKAYAVNALGWFSDQSLINEVLNISISNKIRIQDFRILFNALVSNPSAKPFIMDWLFKNWKTLKKMFLPTDLALASIVKSLGIYNNENELEKFNNFFSKSENLRDDIKLSLLQVKERIRANIKFLEYNKIKA
ncbi:MAG: M1 family metallopeptidase [Candidatus Micrarchaeia archaeon]